VLKCGGGDKMSIWEHIRSDAVNKSLNVGNQTKHIRGSHNFDPTRSEVYGTLEDMQILVDLYHGTGEPIEIAGIWRERERIELNYPIGIYRSIFTGIEYETNIFLIHYGKSGAHIVPARRR
jgi:hypothetical protein